MTSSSSKSELGVDHVRRLWSRVTQRLPANREQSQEWMFDQIVIHGLGLSLEETLQYLGRAPSLEQFEQWIVELNGGRIDPVQIARINAATEGAALPDAVRQTLREVEDAEPVLSEADLHFWREHGYVVLHDAVEAEQCHAAERAVWSFLEMDSAAPNSWYKRHTHGIMVQLFHDPALAATRRSPRIHKAFAQLWATPDLWLSIDRVSFNPPERPGWSFPGPGLHWDTSLAPPIPFSLSGILYLTDTVAEQGAFTCVPGFHRRIVDWLASLPEGADPRMQDLAALGATPIAGAARDLIIWHEALPHGSRPNRAERPRIAQYIRMYPATKETNPVWR